MTNKNIKVITFNAGQRTKIRRDYLLGMAVSTIREQCVGLVKNIKE